VATVVSVPAPERAVVDAGSKTLSSDPLRPKPGGYGQVLGRASVIEKLSEEHGVIAVAPGEAFRVGERIRILPNHACVVANLHDRLVGVSEDRVETVLDVAARGRVR
jgi:D-serine deaminase-like pyridoxal phosphate-dependent protein